MQAMYQSSRKTEWVCRWCYATTHVGIYPGEVLRPPYSYRVWERANVDDLPDGISHAYDWFGGAFCGIVRDGVQATPYPWRGNWPNVCPACKEAVAVIEQRWPLDKRGPRPREYGSSPQPDWPPF